MLANTRTLEPVAGVATRWVKSGHMKNAGLFQRWEGPFLFVDPKHAENVSGALWDGTRSESV